MRSQIIEALRKHAEGHIAKHKANVEVLLEKNVGVAEHPDTLETIEKELKILKSKTLINLASNEYYDSIQSLSENINVISPVFKDKGKDGKFKIISFYAKKARGYMASWLIKNKINKNDDIKKFSEEGYKFSAQESTIDIPVFLRD